MPETISPQQRAGRVSARLREVDGLARHIERVVDALPPLTDAQRARLAALLSTPTRGLVVRHPRGVVGRGARGVVSPR